MRNHLLHISICTAIGLMCGLGTATLAEAAKRSKDTSTSTSSSKSAKNKNEKNDSGESQSERDKRLFRECQGLPNAGACSGYTRR